MKKIVILFVLGIFMCTNCSALCATTKNITVPKATVISYVITQEISSKSLLQGAKIPAKIEKDVYVKNDLIFKADAPGYLYANQAWKARRMGRAGNIKCIKGYFKDASGIEREVTLDTRYSGERKNWAIAIGSVGLNTIIGAPLALFWILKGTEAVIPSGTIGDAQLTEEFNINSL